MLAVNLIFADRAVFTLIQPHLGKYSANFQVYNIEIKVHYIVLSHPPTVQ